VFLPPPFSRPPLVSPGPPSGLFLSQVSFLYLPLSRLLSAADLFIFSISAFWLSNCARRSLICFGSPGFPDFFFISSSCRSIALAVFSPFLYTCRRAGPSL
jgi:hypothetical protein